MRDTLSPTFWSLHLGWILSLKLPLSCISHACKKYLGLSGTCRRGFLPRRSLTSAPSRPVCRPRAAPTLLPVRATNPLRPWFTLSPYLIPLNPQLPPWLLTEHDRLWTALVINNSPALGSASPAAAAGHRASSLVRACSHAVLSLLAFVYLILAARCLTRGDFTSLLLCAASGQSRLALPTKSPLRSRQPLGVSDVATSALPHGEFCLRRRSLRNFLRTLRNRWGG